MTHDPLSQIADPIANSRSYAKKAEIARRQGRGGEDELTIKEKERLREMIDSEVKRYREVVDKRYQVDEMKGSVEKIKVGNAIMPLDDF